jgi:hypothetical protein
MVEVTPAINLVCKDCGGGERICIGTCPGCQRIGVVLGKPLVQKLIEFRKKILHQKEELRRLNKILQEKRVTHAMRTMLAQQRELYEAMRLLQEMGAKDNFWHAGWIYGLKMGRSFLVSYGVDPQIIDHLTTEIEWREGKGPAPQGKRL